MYFCCTHCMSITTTHGKSIKMVLKTSLQSSLVHSRKYPLPKCCTPQRLQRRDPQKKKTNLFLNYLLRTTDSIQQLINQTIPQNHLQGHCIVTLCIQTHLMIIQPYHHPHSIHILINSLHFHPLGNFPEYHQAMQHFHHTYKIYPLPLPLHHHLPPLAHLCKTRRRQVKEVNRESCLLYICHKP